MEAETESLSGNHLPVAAEEATIKKRPLEEEGQAPSSEATSLAPKRRKTSNAASVASSGSVPTRGARHAPKTDSSSSDEYEPSLGSLDLEDMAVTRSQSEAPSTGVSGRVTRSASKGTATNTSSSSDTNKANTKKKPNPLELLVAGKYTIPDSPTVLNPIGDDASWEPRLLHFRHVFLQRNPGMVLTRKRLADSITKYLRHIAWRAQENRRRNVTEAKLALNKAQQSGTLNSIVAGNLGDGGRSNQPATPTDNLPKQPKQSKPARKTWIYPQDPLLLDPDYPGESLENSLKRLCHALVEVNAKSQPNLPRLRKMVGRWVTKRAWADAAQNRTQKCEKAHLDIQVLRNSGKLDEILHDVLGTKAGTAEDPVLLDSDDESVVEEQTRPGSHAGSDAATLGDAQPEPGDSGLSPSASDWAALLGADVVTKDSDVTIPITMQEPQNKAQQPTRAVMDEHEASDEQHKYFPSVTNSPGVCVVCASADHASLACPCTSCRHCVGDHFSWDCPERRRCTKCKQLGHGAAGCKEKLAMTAEEGLDCAFCGSKRHLEAECESIWRSYQPPKQGVRKVRYISAFCSVCGIEGHYSSDCTLRGYDSVSQTWSLANRDEYVDPAADYESISALSVGPVSTDLGPAIKGMASKATHIFYSDSDGSEEGEFIGKKVPPKGPSAQIRMSTNIQFTPLSISQPPSRGQPPLPPGPPPPGPVPKPGGYSSLSHTAPVGNPLPPRPNVPGQMFPSGPQLGINQFPPPTAPSGPSQPGNGRKRGRKPNGGPPAQQQGNGGQNQRKRRRGGK